MLPTAANPFSTFGLDTDTAGYDRTVALARSGQVPDPATIRQEEFINAFDYGDDAPRNAVFRIYAEGARSPFRAGSSLLRVGVKARQLGRLERRALTLTILLDASGSMDSPERLPLAKKAIQTLAAQLGEDDRVHLLTASDRTRVESLASLPDIRARGATNLEDGIRAAFSHALAAHEPRRENIVVIISDGIANLGSNNAADLLALGAEAKARGVRCSVVGVGRGSYNDALLEELAKKGGGEYRFLGSEEDIGPAFADNLKDSFNAVARDVKIQIEWNPDVVAAHRSHGYDRRALTREQFRDDSVEAGVIGSGKGAVAVFEMRLAEGVSPSAVLGVARVRYRRMDTGAVEEIERELRVSDVSGDFARARPRLKLAFAVAEFATILKHLPEGARDEALAKVRTVAREVAAADGGRDVKVFAETTERAK
ncbi:MAG: von Willebrand factor type A domain-containing protein [Kiritimatiellaeota bacterium]|nr:von Willebrand factor type A domain-containing protein [Kiritimatiellota bacterium]